MLQEDKPTFEALDNSEAAILTTYGEARGESYEGKQAVCCVIVNRAYKWRQDIKQVCFAKNQFSCFLSSDPNYQKLLAVANNFTRALVTDEALLECAQAWYGNRSEVSRKLDGATFYRVKGTKNKWYDRQVEAGKLVLVCQIEAHEFHKEA